MLIILSALTFWTWQWIYFSLFVLTAAVDKKIHKNRTKFLLIFLMSWIYLINSRPSFLNSWFVFFLLLSFVSPVFYASQIKRHHTHTSIIIIHRSAAFYETFFFFRPTVMAWNSRMNDDVRELPATIFSQCFNVSLQCFTGSVDEISLHFYHKRRF